MANDASTATDALDSGAEMFGYVIERRLGKGGMGTVYLATQTSLARQVALKVLSRNRIRSQQQIDSFLREARAAARLNHPHLVLIHAVHDDAQRGLYCYSMEYVPGRPLSDLVARQGPLRKQAALHVVWQIARALGHAHRNGFVHRDVKPDNILVTDNGVAKLADLGLARDQMEGVVTTAANRLSIVGTPSYSAPEQCRNPDKASPASDVYSLGACLFFALTGRPPFAGETVIDLIVRSAISPVEYPPTMPADCRGLLEMMLAKDPAQRPANGDAVVSALEEIAAGRNAGEVRAMAATNVAEPAGAADTDETSSASSQRRRMRVRRRRR